MKAKGSSGLLIIFSTFLFLVLAGGVYFYSKNKNLQAIKSYDDCVKAGYPALRSYPGLCNTPDGGHFVQEISVEEKKKIIPPTSKPTPLTGNKSQDCIKEETYNLESNKYIRGDELSVEFYATPSADVIKKLVRYYKLEVIQIYEQPNVIFKISKEKAPTVKCQLKNEPEIKDVVFIESEPLP
ncbi:MAG: hypothetical protein UW69_C0043G0006 [Microgenomates group bacterium GW2011_GWA2_44_7]|nr:MAG: hypothetical protein UW69_C0043G0006 [Microgenomates group bacterium GW2011_GWA2_44_7]